MAENHDTTPDHLMAGRWEKHNRLVESGTYPRRYERTDLASELHQRHGSLGPGTETDEVVAVAGRIMLLRSFGRLQFATLRDWSGAIQLLADQSTLGEEGMQRFGELDLGDWVGARGRVMTTKKGELSVKVEDFVVLQKSLRPLPEKWHGLQDVEQRSRRRYLDLMVNEEARRVASARVRVVSELRRQFETRGFVEVETPVLLTQATGAMARPFSTHHHALDLDMFLRIATELHLKRLVVGGMERVFEIGRIFRNEGIDATHNPEFTMLEAYQAFADYRDVLSLVEEVMEAVAVAVTGASRFTYQGREVDLTPPLRRADLTEVVSEALGVEVDLDTPAERLRELAADRGIDAGPEWSPGRILAEIYEAIEDGIWGPVFVMHQPVEVSPLARRSQADPRVVERFELVIAGSEYANAFTELNDPVDQRARFEAQALARAAGDEAAHPVDEDYLLALEYGLPPTGGLGIGVDRLVMMLTDQAHIREVILFPTLRPE